VNHSTFLLVYNPPTASQPTLSPQVLVHADSAMQIPYKGLKNAALRNYTKTFS